MVELKHRECTEANPQARKIISRQIDGVDAMLDKAVYKLYGLPPDYIAIIEGVINEYC
jgi:hypothetical protein